MKIRMFCRNDYANMMFGVCKALKLQGLDSECYVTEVHPFGYSEQATHVSYGQMKELAKDADVIHIFHSDNHVIPHIQGDWKGRKLFVWHTGTPYRINSRFHDNFWKGYKVITDQAEFIAGGLRADFIPAGVDFEALGQVKEEVRYKFAHCPSNQEVKGTVEIRRIADSCKVPIHIDVKLLPSVENIKRMAACEVYVELFAPTNLNKPYGHWGVAAMEAAALGRIVITNEVSEVYKRFYGESFVYAANNEHHFAAILQIFNGMPKEELAERQYDTWAIANKNHNYKAVAERVMNGL